MPSKIKMCCKGNRSLPWGKLKKFQGNLKNCTEEEAGKLRRSIVELGWIAPVFVWNKNEIIDGTHRILVLEQLIQEGYTIDEIPIVDILARDKKNAAKILLQITSSHAKVTDEGLYEYMSKYNLEIPDIENISLPDIKLEKFEVSYFGEPEEEERPEKKKKECPKCGFKF